MVSPVVTRYAAAFKRAASDGSVLVSRILVKEGREKAVFFGLALAVATLITGSSLVTFESAFGFLEPFLLIGFIGLTLWSVNKLTWDCTVIDSSRDASAVGLAELARRKLTGQEANEPVATDVSPGRSAPSSTPNLNREASDAQAGNFLKALFSGKQRQNTPGLWVFYFSIVALPVFGMGQWFILPTNEGWAMFLFGVYFASALALMMTTSLLGLQRYLMQRQVELPDHVARSWMVVGAVMAVIGLGLVMVLPRPNIQSSVSNSLAWFGSKPRPASDFAMGKDGQQQKSSGISSSDKADPSKGAGEGKSENSGGKQQGQKQSGSSGNNKEKGSGSSSSGKSKSEGESGGSKQKQQQQQDQKQSPSSKSDDNKSQNSKSDQKGDPSKAGEKGGEKSDAEKSDPAKNDAAKNEPQPNSPRDPNMERERARREAAEREKKEKEQKQSESSSNSQSPMAAPPPEQSNQQNQAPDPQSPNFPNVSPSLQSLGQFVIWLIYAAGIVAILVAAWLFRKEIIAGWVAFLESIRKWFNRSRDPKTTAVGGAAATRAVGPIGPKFAEYHNPFSNPTARGMSTAQMIEYSFAAMEAFARDRQSPRDPDQTPYEFAHELAGKIKMLDPTARQLAEIYGQLVYGQAAVDPQQLEPLRHLWQNMEQSAVVG